MLGPVQVLRLSAADSLSVTTVSQFRPEQDSIVLSRTTRSTAREPSLSSILRRSSFQDAVSEDESAPATPRGSLIKAKNLRSKKKKKVGKKI